LDEQDIINHRQIMQKMKKMMILGLLILNLVFSISKKEKMKKLYMGFD